MDDLRASGIFYCPLRELYFGARCERHPASIQYGHDDVYVGDMLTLDDLDSHDLGHDLARIRYEQKGRL